MKKKLLLLIVVLGLIGCNSDDETTPRTPQVYNLLSLGDSYTIGQSVCETCRFPEQLKDSLIQTFPEEDSFNLQVIAQTGWKTTDLINAIANEDPPNTFDFVTLLIGVNNQYQNRPFSLYEEEFPILATKAIELAQGSANNVVVVSIPDYAFTPFGQGFGFSPTTSEEIDQYNTFAENYCVANGIAFINITDITRQGLVNTDLVAADGLHPSELAYALFVERILPEAIHKLQ
ncbi:MAG: SGNH/GDSL hydrolase family protein [Winogradskyella sp.]